MKKEIIKKTQTVYSFFYEYLFYGKIIFGINILQKKSEINF